MARLFDTDLQPHLGGPRREQAARELRARLDALERRLRADLRAGQSRTEFEMTTALAEAAAVSRAVIDDLILDQ